MNMRYFKFDTNQMISIGITVLYLETTVRSSKISITHTLNWV